MPTGGGKSLTFQLPALVSPGFTLVISPLVSLMEDQLMSLQEYKINACLLNAGSTRAHVNNVHNNMINKDSGLKILYVTPEKIAKSKRFMNKLEKAYAGAVHLPNPCTLAGGGGIFCAVLLYFIVQIFFFFNKYILPD